MVAQVLSHYPREDTIGSIVVILEETAFLTWTSVILSNRELERYIHNIYALVVEVEL